MLVSELCENGDLFDYIVSGLSSPNRAPPNCSAQCALPFIEESREFLPKKVDRGLELKVRSSA